ncbi:uncharacterized protein BXZ73DRAFT_77973 [Epithele typhae]|uniref:uncharacterized protein n=1 Tax=Epithele typhae TaxID=378194 RepID=UPI002007DE11|nr:uncharacterized protein BXZ73DRAFT_77973 [Epithele typhae]KAH9929849.1 hypothetical protein BXZ73DRAFT_77973 [Epithele typhae]
MTHDAQADVAHDPARVGPLKSSEKTTRRWRPNPPHAASAWSPHIPNIHSVCARPARERRSAPLDSGSPYQSSRSRLGPRRAPGGGRAADKDRGSTLSPGSRAVVRDPDGGPWGFRRSATRRTCATSRLDSLKTRLPIWHSCFTQHNAQHRSNRSGGGGYSPWTEIDRTSTYQHDTPWPAQEAFPTPAPDVAPTSTSERFVSVKGTSLRRSVRLAVRKAPYIDNDDCDADDLTKEGFPASGRFEEVPPTSDDDDSSEDERSEVYCSAVGMELIKHIPPPPPQQPAALRKKIKNRKDKERKKRAAAKKKAAGGPRTTAATITASSTATDAATASAPAPTTTAPTTRSMTLSSTATGGATSSLLSTVLIFGPRTDPSLTTRTVTIRVPPLRPNPLPSSDSLHQ